MLHLGRVLGRTVDQHIAVLGRDRHGDLALKVEMLLPAHVNAAGKPQRRPSQGGVGVATLHHLGRQDETPRRQGLINRQDWLADFVFDHRL